MNTETPSNEELLAAARAAQATLLERHRDRLERMVALRTDRRRQDRVAWRSASTSRR
jgi:hypothetical protein